MKGMTLKSANKQDANNAPEDDYGKSSQILNMNYNINPVEKFEGFGDFVSRNTSA